MGEKFNKFTTLISVHAPTEEKYELDKLHQTYQRIPAHDTKIIMGDYDAKIGRK
jgi:hypothetical protein